MDVAQDCDRTQPVHIGAMAESVFPKCSGA